MLRIISAISIIVFVPFVHAANLQGLEAEIDQFVQTFQDTPDTGIAIGVVQGGQLVFFKGYGYRDRALQLPVTKDTLFRIGSNTKSFLSTSLTILAEEGRLNLENTVQSYLPLFALESSQVAQQATLVDLLSHRVGLPRHDLLWYLTTLSREELFSRLQYLEMNKKPGFGFRGNFQYNNLMFMTLGMVGEKVSGLSWQDLVRQKILNPLNMKNTNFSVDESQKSADYAQPYTGELLLPFKPYDPIGSAGVMNSSVSDLTNWVGLFLNEGMTGTGQRLFSPEGQERMFRVESQWTMPGRGIEFKYGLGWMIQEVACRRLIWHGGNIDGFSAHVSFMPEENLGLIVLVNQSNAGNFEYPFAVKQNGVEYKLLPMKIYEHLLDKKDGPPTPYALVASATLRRLEGFPNPTRMQFSKFVQSFSLKQSLSFLTLDFNKNLGTFSEVAYGDIAIYQDYQNALHLVYFEADWLLKPTPSEDVFKIFTGIDGEDTGMTATLEWVGDEIVAIQIPLEPEVRPIRFVK